jgi:hypothetical protein
MTAATWRGWKRMLFDGGTWCGLDPLGLTGSSRVLWCSRAERCWVPPAFERPRVHLRCARATASAGQTLFENTRQSTTTRQRRRAGISAGVRSGLLLGSVPMSLRCSCSFRRVATVCFSVYDVRHIYRARPDDDSCCASVRRPRRAAAVTTLRSSLGPKARERARPNRAQVGAAHSRRGGAPGERIGLVS